MRMCLGIILTGLFLQGCVTAPTLPVKDVTVVTVEPGMLPAAALGMKREDILPLLDRNVVTGYEQDSATGEFRPKTSKALYSTEMVEIGGIDYLVDTYIVSDLKTGKPGDNDMCPLIYQKDILVGKGRAEFDALKAKAVK